MVSKNQELAIKKCMIILDGWLNTHDIYSPSHYNIIDEYMFDLEDDTLDGENPEILSKHMIGLLNVIRRFE